MALFKIGPPPVEVSAEAEMVLGEIVKLSVRAAADIEKPSALDTAVPVVLTFATVTVAVPGLATSEARIKALNWVAEMRLVARALPFHCTADDEVKFAPLTTSVNPAAPAWTALGERAVNEGGVPAFAASLTA